MRWKIHANQVEGLLRVGICDHEHVRPQRVIINVVLEVDTPAYPTDIAECFDYRQIVDKVWKDWETRAQTPYIEPLAAEMAEYLLNMDARVAQVTVGVFKPDVWPGKANVGVEVDQAGLALSAQLTG